MTLIYSLTTPRSIRSDELLYFTPYTIGQVKAGFPYINKSQGQGENMSVIADVPYKEWSIIFRPQNLVFFVLPLEYAFALKWWLLGFLLVVSCYYFCLALLPHKRLWAALISCGLFFSPFVQWWYLTTTIGCLFYSFFIMLLVMKLLDPCISPKKRWILCSLLAYCLVCFGLILYPPFQIPCIFVIVSFLVGYYIEQRRCLTKRQLLASLGALAASTCTALIILLVFIKTRLPVIEAVLNTAYPGKRTVQGGGFSATHFLSSHLAVYFQSDARAIKYPLNQSEASSFILLSPFLLLASAVVTAKQLIAKRSIPWMIVSINLIFLIFLSRLFLPNLDSVFTALQLGSVPLTRLTIGIGLLGVIQLVVLLHYQLALSNRATLSCAVTAVLVSLVAGFRTEQIAPGFIINTWQLAALSVAMGCIVWCVLQRTRLTVTFGLSLLFLLSLLSTININPLYRGLSPLTDSKLARAIRETGKPSDGWAATGTRLIVMLPFVENKQAITGVYLYPQPKVWQPLSASTAPPSTYNRFAHVILDVKDAPTEPASLELKAPDHFVINAGTCSRFLQTSHVRYIVTSARIASQGCATLVKTVDNPATDFYIYQLHN